MCIGRGRGFWAGNILALSLDTFGLAGDLLAFDGDRDFDFGDLSNTDRLAKFVFGSRCGGTVLGF